MKVIYVDAFLNRQDAEIKRDEFLSSFQKNIEDGEFVILEDEIKFINLHYSVRIMLGSPQKELDFE